MPENKSTNPTSADIFTQHDTDERLNGHFNTIPSQSQVSILTPTQPQPQTISSASVREPLPKLPDYLMSISLAGGIITLVAVLTRPFFHAAAKNSGYYKGSGFFAPDLISTMLALCGSISGIVFSIALIFYLIRTTVRTPDKLKEKLPGILIRITLNLSAVLLFTFTFWLQ